MVYTFKDMFTVKDREVRIRRDSDMTLSEDCASAILKTISNFKDFLAHFQLTFAKQKLVSKHCETGALSLLLL